MSAFSLLSAVWLVSSTFAAEDSSDDGVMMPFFTVSLADSVTLESVEYDSTTKMLFYQSFAEGIIYAIDYDSDLIEEETFTLSGAVAMDNNNFTVEFPTGMYANGEYLYVLSAVNGFVTVFDIETMTAMMQIEIMYNGASTRLNGLCADPNDDSIIYVTCPGADFIYTGSYTNDSALYKVNIDTATYEMVADFGGSEHPNGCAVSSDGGSVYMVSFWLNGAGNFIRYTASDSSTTVLTGMESVSADGLVFDNDWNLYTTHWGNTSTNGKLFQVSGFGSDSAVTLEEYATGLANPADCSYDMDNNWVVIPNFDSTGGISWVALDDSDGSGSDDSAVHHILSQTYMVATILFGLYAAY